MSKNKFLDDDDLVLLNLDDDAADAASAPVPDAADSDSKASSPKNMRGVVIRINKDSVDRRIILDTDLKDFDNVELFREPEDTAPAEPAAEEDEDADIRIHTPGEKIPPAAAVSAAPVEEEPDEPAPADEEKAPSEETESGESTESEKENTDADAGKADSGEEASEKKADAEAHDAGEDEEVEPIPIRSRIQISSEPAPEENEDAGEDEELELSDAPSRFTVSLGRAVAGIRRIAAERKRRRAMQDAGLISEEDKPRPEGRERKNTSQLADLPARQLASIYGSGLSGMTVRIVFAMLFTVLLGYVSLSDCLNLPILRFFWEDVWAAAASLELLGIVVLLLADCFLRGFTDLLDGKPGMHTLVSFSVIFTVLDSVYFILLGRDGPLPCTVVAAAALCFSAWGQRANRSALRLSCRSVASSASPHRLVRQRDDQGRTDVLLNIPGDNSQFGSQIQETDGVQRISGPVSAVILALSLILGTVSALSREEPELVLWCISVILCTSTPFASTMAWALPYRRIARRLSASSAAIAGWDGARELNGAGQVVITDTDLFPTGMITCNGIHTYGNISGDLVVSYCATLVRESHSGLGRTFADLVYSQGTHYMTDQLRRYYDFENGGIGGDIGHDHVLLGTADFMRANQIQLPDGISVKTAAFCAVNGDLAAQLALIYRMPAYVVPSFESLLKNKVSVTMGTLDFNLNTMLLSRTFGVPMHNVKMQTMDIRSRKLNPQEQPEGSILGALLSREGLDAHSDAVLGAKSLVRIVRKNTRWVIAASVIGLLFGFFLTYMRAFTSLQPVNVLLFGLLWLIPPFLNAWQTDKY